MDFIVFSDDWARHPSSCQHLFRVLTAGGVHRALWVNTIGMRSAKLDSFTAGRSMEKFRQWAKPLVRVNENFHVYSPAMLPVGGKSKLASANASLCAARIRSAARRIGLKNPILFSSIPTGADYIGLLGESAVVYYITDNYQLWPGGSPEVIAAQDTRLKLKADLLLPVGDELASGLENCSGRVLKLPHAVDLEHFSNGLAADTPPVDMKKIPGPRLCFFGLIYEKIDLDLLANVAIANPDKSLVMIGPVKCDVSRLEKISNVYFLGPKPYEQLPGYLNACDATLLAYKLDEQTTRNAPLKIRECLAVGKPVIAIKIPDLQQYGHLIHIADDIQQFIELCGSVESLSGDAAAMRAAVSGQSWQARAGKLEDELKLMVSAQTDFSRVNGVKICQDTALWNSYLRDKPEAGIFNDHRWTKILNSAYGIKCYPLVYNHSGRIAGCLPLAFQKSVSFGRHLVSMPWLDYCGVIADDNHAANQLINSALKIAEDLDCDLQIRNIDADSEKMQSHPALNNSRKDKIAMVLDLPGDADQLWSGFKAKVRNQVRKAEKSGLEIRWAGPAELEEFYDIYSHNMRDLGSPPHSLEFFRQVMESFGTAARLLLIDKGDIAVAGAFILTDKYQWQVPWASSLRKYNTMCPNHLMYWTIISEACGRASTFSFGRSSRDSGTYKFKAQWGSRELPLRWDFYLSDGNSDGRPSKFAQLISRAWQKLPVPVAKKLGPGIIRSVS